ncbi:MAG TPA: hypothetical protein VMZ06_15905 [Candidatus Bathyarchaeia archaeon]|nr:hypothetical protein [Candidatus Bathyarchaeia archaeon]
MKSRKERFVAVLFGAGESWLEWPWRFRLLGLVPLTIFLLHFHYNWSQGNPGHVLWMCHVSNLALAIGLLLGHRGLIRLAPIWLLPGIPLWIMDMLSTRQMPPITFLSHLVCPVVGLIALREVRAGRWTWLRAFLWFLFIQQISRMFTPPELNVNVAHSIYPGWERFFTAYWQYWLFTAASSALALYVVGRLLLWFAPPHKPEPLATAAAPPGD